MDGAVKHDQGKVRMDLVPPAAIWALAEVYTVGAAKYGEHNWRKGMSWGRIFAAILRHIWAWAMGEELDPEDGIVPSGTCHVGIGYADGVQTPGVGRG